MTERPIQVLIVDDHEVVRKSIKAMLAKEPDIQVIGTAVDGREAIQVALNLNPDVIVMDLSMPGLDGVRAAGDIQALGLSARIIILSMHHNSALVQQARKNGATGYIMKQKANSELVPAIRAASEGDLSL